MTVFTTARRSGRRRSFGVLVQFVLLLSPGWASELPSLQLAERYHPGIPLADYWVSEKLDGVRAYWNGQQLLSRQGNRINAPSWFAAGLPAEVALDGELWMGRGRFEELSGAVRTLEPRDAQWRLIRYHVFDLPAATGTFTQRLERLRDVVATAEAAHLIMVEQRRVADHVELMQRLDAIIAAGGEGLMLHRGAAHHRGERTRNLLKVKRHDDAEAVVIGYTLGRGKYTGLVGALKVRAPDGREFRIGSGLTDALRHDPPSVGSTITYQFSGLTNSGLPRFAVFLRQRQER